ncbi:50S ribosomal protein L11 methyltransferase [Streptomyces sp. NBC_00963]|uniref:50S ribosomal protein L11 methyltransferase n=1 Tax=Streptomyces sp. NBC_00963 TaxID=2903697 RepID=UPI00386864AE|nr:50S ribosomal protein L11 methyltransferase [Streptomyces sp. NBC_00963]
MNWKPHAVTLAHSVTHAGSRWHAPVAALPRHLFIPRWWAGGDGWSLRAGADDDQAWLAAAYADDSLVTRVGSAHADQAQPGDRPAGRPTSSATLPSLLVRMFQHARLGDGHTLLDVGTGSGYGTGLACLRLGERQVSSVDVDPYLTEAAGQRLDQAGLRPQLHTLDASGELPGNYDRIVATVGVRPVPTSWLTALKPGGRLVTTVAGTTLIVTADKQDDGTARGRVEWDRAGFMHARHSTDYHALPDGLIEAARTEKGEFVTASRYPVVDVEQAWDLSSMLGIEVPGIVYGYEETGQQRAAWLAHPDGSWARATSKEGGDPVVHQSGPRHLWDVLDEIRSYWLQHGELPVRGAHVLITPDGRTRLARGGWRATL